jgi:hypothetical protein
MSERGFALAFGRYNEMTPTEVTDLRDGRPWTPA